jgi:phosphotransferase system IIB component
MSFNPQVVADQIFQLTSIGSIKTVAVCMTRFRINLSDYSQIDLAALKEIDGVADAVIVDNQLQIVMGLGNGVKVYECFKPYLENDAAILAEIKR